MPSPSSNPARHAGTGKSRGRPLTVVELLLVLEELDRIVDELEASLTELALPLDDASRFAARSAIACAARRGA
jgi:hypothetical protein